jgi:hypothetical protein
MKDFLVSSVEGHAAPPERTIAGKTGAPVSELQGTPLSSDSATRFEDVLRREAEFRLKVAREYVEVERTLRSQAEKIDALNKEIGLGKTYVHNLHLERDRLRSEIWRAREDLEFFIFRIQELLERQEVASAPPSAPYAFLEGGRFRYHLSPSPFRLHRTEEFRMGGWVQPDDGHQITGLRVRIGSREFLPEIQPTEADTAGALPGAPVLVFEFNLALPPGRSFLMLEAWVDSTAWRSVLNAPTWRKD